MLHFNAETRLSHFEKEKTGTAATNDDEQSHACLKETSMVHFIYHSTNLGRQNKR
jgi:hypothetical protein